MKKNVLLLLLCLSLSACSSGVSQAEYESVVAERNEYKATLESIATIFSDDLSLNQAENAETETPADSTPSDLLEQMTVNEYSYTTNLGTTWYFLEIANNSPVPVSVETNVIAKDENGNAIGASSGEISILENGYSGCISHMFEDCSPSSFEYSISVSEEDYWIPVQSDISYEVSDTGNKLIVACTNIGDDSAEFVEGIALFFAGDELLDFETAYIMDGDSELKPGNTIAEELDYNGDVPYDNYKLYIDGRRS